jgi:hypothetical protein
MVPHSLLKQLFQSLEIDTHDLSWETMKNRETKPFLSLFQELPLEKQNQLEGLCYDIFALASESGWDALCQTAEECNESEWCSLSSEKINLYTKSLWSWLHYPEIFQKALALHNVEHLTLWRKREGLPQITPEWNAAVKESLEQALQNFFTEKQGRGYVCTAEMQHYRDGVYYFIAHPDDYVKSVLHHDESGELIFQTTRPTFEIVFVYNRAEGTLEIHARCGEKIKMALEEIFIETLFPNEVEEFSDRIYDLSVLKDEHFSLAPRPSDRIEIRLKEITLNWVGKQSVTLKTKYSHPTTDWIRRSLSEKELSWENAEVTRVKFQFQFLPEKDKRRGSLTFEIATPNKSTLRNQDAARIEIARHYLKIWGIEHDAHVIKKIDESFIRR